MVGTASKLIVSAMMDDELVLAIVDADAEGLSKITYPTIDAQSCAEISFENVQLDNTAIISKGS